LEFIVTATTRGTNYMLEYYPIEANSIEEAYKKLGKKYKEDPRELESVGIYVSEKI